MQKLDNQQKSFVDNEILKIQNRIKQLQSMINEQDAPKLKRDFIGQQIKQLNVILDSLKQMKQD